MFQLPGGNRLWNFIGGSVPNQPAVPAYPPGTVPNFPRPSRPAYAVDQVLQQVWPNPWYGPNDLDPVVGMEPEQRALYLALYKKEPRLNAAIEGKVASVATLDVTVRGADEDNPRDAEAASFIDAAVKTSRQSWKTLIASILRAGFIFGWSAGEITLQPIERGKFRGRWGLKHVRGLNTEPFIRLQLDTYRNIVGVVNLIRGIQDYSPDKFVFYTHKPLFANPFGQSDVQPAERAARLFREVYQVWYIALKRYGLPYMHGQVSNPNYRQMLEQALEDLQGSGFAVTGPEDKINVINLAAAAAASGFEAAIDKFSEDIFYAVRGAATPSQATSNKGGDVRHNTEMSKDTGSDPIEQLIAEEVCLALNLWLVPALMKPNYGPDVGYPIVTLSGVDYDGMKSRLDVLKAVEDSGRKVSSKDWYKTANAKPADPNDPLDAKVLAQPAPGMPGSPPGGPPTGPGSPPPDAGPKPAALPPKPPAPAAGPKPPVPAPKPSSTNPNSGAMGPAPGDGSNKSAPAAAELPANSGVSASNNPAGTVPPELVVAMLEAAAEGDHQAVDKLAELGSDPEGLSEFLADREAGTQGMMTARAFAAMSRNFSAFAGTWLEADHPRAKDGRFGEGEHDPDDADPDDTPLDDSDWHDSESLKSAADTKAASIIDRLKSIPATILATVRAKVAAAYEKLTARYGKTYARLAVAAGVAGLPVPLPGASVMMAAPVLAIAELHKQLGELVGTVDDPGALREAARWFVGLVSGRPQTFSAHPLTFGWFADPTPRSKSRATNSDTGQHLYGEQARRALAWQGREDRGEPHPKSPKQLLIDQKAAAEPKREAARQAYKKALGDPGSLRPEELSALRDHLHTLTRDEIRGNLRTMLYQTGGKLKADLVDALLDHVRTRGEESRAIDANPPAYAPHEPHVPTRPVLPDKVRRARELVSAIKNGERSPDRLRELAGHVPRLTQDEMRGVAAALGSGAGLPHVGYGGPSNTRQKFKDALLAHAERLAGKAAAPAETGQKPPGPAPVPEPSPPGRPDLGDFGEPTPGAKPVIMPTRPAPGPDAHDRAQYEAAEDRRERMEQWERDKPNSQAAQDAAEAARLAVEREKDRHAPEQQPAGEVPGSEGREEYERGLKRPEPEVTPAAAETDAEKEARQSREQFRKRLDITLDQAADKMGRPIPPELRQRLHEKYGQLHVPGRSTDDLIAAAKRDLIDAGYAREPNGIVPEAVPAAPKRETPAAPPSKPAHRSDAKAAEHPTPPAPPGAHGPRWQATGEQRKQAHLREQATIDASLAKAPEVRDMPEQQLRAEAERLGLKQLPGETTGQLRAKVAEARAGGPQMPFGAFSTDAEGHEHRGKGPGGGQFAPKGEGGSGGGGVSGAKSEPPSAPRQLARMPETEDEAKALALAARQEIVGSDPDAKADVGQCIDAALALASLSPDIEIYRGLYAGDEDNTHYIVKAGDYFIDVTGDQFEGGEPVVVFTEDEMYGRASNYSRMRPATDLDRRRDEVSASGILDTLSDLPHSGRMIGTD